MEPVDRTPTRPRDYAALNMAWAGLMGAVLAGTKDDPPPLEELPLYGLASFALTKALAKEKVGTWVREPVVDEADGDKRPKGRGLRYAAGELLTCTRCLGTWSSLGLVALRVVRPREGRIVATVLAASALNDFTQTGFTWLTAQANIAEQDAAHPPEPEDSLEADHRFWRQAENS